MVFSRCPYQDWLTYILFFNQAVERHTTCISPSHHYSSHGDTESQLPALTKTRHRYRVQRSFNELTCVPLPKDHRALTQHQSGSIAPVQVHCSDWYCVFDPVIILWLTGFPLRYYLPYIRPWPCFNTPILDMPRFSHMIPPCDLDIPLHVFFNKVFSLCAPFWHGGFRALIDIYI